jgi:3-methyladenine DNA glycosylase AlkC
MAQALKDIFSKDFFEYFITHFSPIYPINATKFYSILFDNDWEQRALKQRITHIAQALHACLPMSYVEQINVFLTYIHHNQSVKNSDWMLGYMFIPEFIQLYGIENYHTSIQAIEQVTQYSSCEFAIRPFIQKYPETTIKQMLVWSQHNHPSVRRLASEGCRPRLPWAPQLPEFMKDPSPLIPILEQLNNDESAFVKTSVANNINDISKDNPQIALHLCKQWKKYNNKNTEWIIKHGLRSLLKLGNAEAFNICSLSTSTKCVAEDVVIHTSHVSAHNPLHLSFDVANRGVTPEICKIAYALHFLRQNGTYFRKVFHIRELEIRANTSVHFEKKHSFITRSTRVYYAGLQYISIIVNGAEGEKNAFVYCENS